MLKKTVIMVFMIAILASGGRVNAADSTYCVDDTVLHVKASPNITVGSTVIQFTAEEIACQYGCRNDSWMALGNPACEESPVQTFTIIIAVIIVVAIVVGRWFK